MMVGVKGNAYVRLIVSWLMITVLVMFCSISIARADESDQKGSSAKVMEAFEKQATQNKIDGPSAIQKKTADNVFFGGVVADIASCYRSARNCDGDIW